MSQTVTLGGDRLGSGNKMKVDLRTYDRSTHNLSEIFRSTMSAGTLVPCYKKLCLPGDRWEIELDLSMLTHPTEGPLFASYKAQVDAFIIPMRLYQAKLHMNMTNIGRNMSAIKLPLVEQTAEIIPANTPDLNNAQVNPSSLLAYLGIRGIGARNNVPTGDITRYFNAVPILGYYEIAKNYYWNKQEEIGAVIHTGTPATVTTVDTIEFNGNIIAEAPAFGNEPLLGANKLTINFTGAEPLPETIMINTEQQGPISMKELAIGGNYGLSAPGILEGIYDTAKWGTLIAINWRYREPTDITVQTPRVVTFPIENIDTMRQHILTAALDTSAFVINEVASPQVLLEPYAWLDQRENMIPHKVNTQEGLAVKTYQSDLFNNWVNTDWIDGAGGIAEVTAIDTSSGEFTMDQLNLSKKVYNMLNRIAVSGGTYKDWIDVTYTESGAWRADSPVYLGSLIKELVFQEVVSNSQSADQPLGTIAGKGVLAQKHKGGYINFSVDEPSYLMIIASLTPRIDYSQGNDWDIHLQTMDDFHKAALDEIGFQELITEQMAWWDTQYNDTTSQWEVKSAGKQPAWINYMTSVNKTYGNFAVETNEMFMTLNRRYEAEPSGDNYTIKDLTTYIDPAKYNSIFAIESLDAQNFWTQIKIDAKVRRVMSGKLMPTV